MAAEVLMAGTAIAPPVKTSSDLMDGRIPLDSPCYRVYRYIVLGNSKTIQIATFAFCSALTKKAVILPLQVIGFIGSDGQICPRST